MGYSKYYEFYPPLQDDELDKWNLFIQRLLNEYWEYIKETEDAYIIRRGESPSISKNGKLFRGYSSKISCCKEIEGIMDGIAIILSEIFPDRVFISDDNSCNDVYAYNDELLTKDFTPTVPQTKKEFIKLLAIYDQYPTRLKADIIWWRSH